MVVAGLPDSGPGEHDAPRPWRDEIVLGDLHRHHPIPAPLPRESRQPVPQVGEAHEPARRLLHVFSAIDPEPRDGRRILPQPASVCTRAASQVQQGAVASEIAARISGSQGGIEAATLRDGDVVLVLTVDACRQAKASARADAVAEARQRPGQLSPCIGTLALAQQRDSGRPAGNTRERQSLTRAEKQKPLLPGGRARGPRQESCCARACHVSARSVSRCSSLHTAALGRAPESLTRLRMATGMTLGSEPPPRGAFALAANRSDRADI
eukprot:scaffold56443_cov65-Phaeocystis_antarctica.AAC.3